MKYLVFNYNRDFLALWDEDAKRIFQGSENIALMPIEKLAVHLGVLDRFSLVDMYAKSYHNNTPASQNPVDIAFNLNRQSASLEKCITFMCDYLGAFRHHTIEKGDLIMVYSTDQDFIKSLK